MKTVVITIQVPDGTSVAVNNGGTASDRPFVPREAPPMPPGGCPVHDADWKLVPAGTSKKSGKQYNAFWVCSVQGCDEKPGREAAFTDVSGGSDLPW